MPRRKAIRRNCNLQQSYPENEARLYNDIYIYIYIFIEINGLDLSYETSCWKSVDVTFLFQKDTTLFFSNDSCMFVSSQYSILFLVRYRCARSHFIFFDSGELDARETRYYYTSHFCNSESRFCFTVEAVHRLCPFRLGQLRQMIRRGN